MQVTVSAVQMACGDDADANRSKAEDLIRSAAAEGANIVLPQELFALRQFHFFEMAPAPFALAEPVDGPTVSHMRTLARDLGVVIPVNFFEAANNAYYNTNAVIDADGSLLGLYRKAHIPLGLPGCFEKVYSNPGDTGFLAFDTGYGRIGAAVCWDQWFPEAARIMALKGAEMLFYPTAIGSDCHAHWQIVMRGHAGANMVPLIAANRIGTETGERGSLTFWGRSFIAGPTGEILQEMGSGDEGAILQRFDLDALREQRAHWGLFRDRRPDLYAPLLTQDGHTRMP